MYASSCALKAHKVICDQSVTGEVGVVVSIEIESGDDDTPLISYNGADEIKGLSHRPHNTSTVAKSNANVRSSTISQRIGATPGGEDDQLEAGDRGGHSQLGSVYTTVRSTSSSAVPTGGVRRTSTVSKEPFFGSYTRDECQPSRWHMQKCM